MSSVMQIPDCSCDSIKVALIINGNSREIKKCILDTIKKSHSDTVPEPSNKLETSPIDLGTLKLTEVEGSINTAIALLKLVHKWDLSQLNQTTPPSVTDLESIIHYSNLRDLDTIYNGLGITENINLILINYIKTLPLDKQQTLLEKVASSDSLFFTRAFISAGTDINHVLTTCIVNKNDKAVQTLIASGGPAVTAAMIALMNQNNKDSTGTNSTASTGVSTPKEDTPSVRQGLSSAFQEAFKQGSKSILQNLCKAGPGSAAVSAGLQKACNEIQSGNYKLDLTASAKESLKAAAMSFALTQGTTLLGGTTGQQANPTIGKDSAQEIRQAVSSAIHDSANDLFKAIVGNRETKEGENQPSEQPTNLVELAAKKGLSKINDFFKTK